MLKQDISARNCLLPVATWNGYLNFLISFQPSRLCEIPYFGNSPYSCGSAAGTVSASPKIVDVAAGWPAGPKCSEEEELTGFDSAACDEAVCEQLLCQVRLSPSLLKETVDEEELLLQNRDISLPCEEQQTNRSNRRESFQREKGCILQNSASALMQRDMYHVPRHAGKFSSCKRMWWSNHFPFSVIIEFFQANRLEQNH